MNQGERQKKAIHIIEHGKECAKLYTGEKEANVR